MFSELPPSPRTLLEGAAGPARRASSGLRKRRKCAVRQSADTPLFVRAPRDQWNRAGTSAKGSDVARGSAGGMERRLNTRHRRAALDAVLRDAAADEEPRRLIALEGGMGGLHNRRTTALFVVAAAAGAPRGPSGTKSTCMATPPSAASVSSAEAARRRLVGWAQRRLCRCMAGHREKGVAQGGRLVLGMAGLRDGWAQGSWTQGVVGSARSCSKALFRACRRHRLLPFLENAHKVNALPCRGPRFLKYSASEESNQPL